ncbi:hypothetical protein HDR60_04520 [bacterium]|nr:hypothetical protein [bacterium]MDE6223997.1 hypothetical protein [Alphaproteobacteria bacterium]
MNKKSYIFLCVFFTNFLSMDVFATGVGGCGAGSGLTTVVNNNLYRILLQYCVPREGDCSVKATYSNGKCICSGKTVYLDRECYEPKCPAGTYLYYSNDTDTCPAGTIKVHMKN